MKIRPLLIALVLALFPWPGSPAQPGGPARATRAAALPPPDSAQDGPRPAAPSGPELAEGPEGFDPATMMRLADVRRGMIGVGKSVFKGTRIEEFHVQLIGVVPKARLGTDLILFKILDGPPVQRKAGVISGMSGTPVYVGGKLVGAIGFGWSFTREAIGAISPIESMLRAWEPGPQSEVAPSGSPVELSAPLTIGGRTIQRVAVEQSFSSQPQVEAPGTLTLRPLGTLAVAVGFQGRALDRLRSLLEPLGLTLMQGGGSAKDFGAPEMLQPGAVVGVKLMEGDLEVAGVGTLTYRSRDRILAFGHPFMTLTDPEVDFGMSPGYVHDILASLEVSAKLSSVGRVVGRINRDRAWAIGGEVGRPPNMMPLTVQVNGGSRSQAFHVRIARHRLITPGMAATAVMTAVDQTLGYVGEGTAQVTLNLFPKGRPPITRRDLVYSGDVAAAVTQQVAEPLAGFTDTPFGTVDFERVEVSAQVHPDHDTALVERIYTTETKARAGKSLDLNIVLRPFAKDKVTRTVRLEIPADMPTGRLRIGVSGGDDAERMRQALNLARVVPVNLDQLVERYQTREAPQKLVIQAALPTRGVSLPLDSLPSLPRSVGNVLMATRSSAIRPVYDSLTQVLDTDWVVYGRQVITLPLEGRPGAPKAAPAPPPQPPQGPPPSGEEEEGPPGEEGDAVSAAPVPAEALSVQDPDGASPIPREAGSPERSVWPLAAPPSPPRRGASGNEKAAEKTPEAPKPVIRQPARWVHATRGDFEDGKLRGTILDTDGTLRLARPPGRTWDLPADAVWSLAAADQVAYAGTGNRGVIYKLTEDADPSPFFETGQAIVHCLALDSDGNLYAGTSPHGRVYKIAPSGEGSVFFETGQTYVWALAFDAQGRLLAGTGPGGRVFRIAPDGQGGVIATCQATHILGLALGPAGEVYAGTGDNAVIYRLTADGPPAALFNLPGGQVHGLAVGEHGELFAAVTPAGAIYRINSGGDTEKLLDTGDNPLFSLLREGDALYTATGSKGLVFRLRSDKIASLLLKPEMGQSLSLALGPGGDLYVGGANPPVVRRLPSQNRRSGHFQAEVLDAGAVAHWGRLTWYARAPKGTRVTFQTRSGNTTDPKDRWSDWSAEIASPGHLVPSPSARYLQYRVNLYTDDPASGPEVSQIEIDYLPQNRKPKVALSAPKPGEWWAKKQKIEWKGDDPDKDTLLYDVSYSVDESAHWESLKQETKDTSYEWDTSKIEDGLYTLKVEASDRLTSPASPETEEAKRLVGVDNTEPVAFILRHSVTVAPDRRVTLRGDAWDATSAVRGVDYRVDEGEWLAATPDDGMFDAPRVGFSVTTDALSPRTHVVEVRALDGASNIGTDKVKVKVERTSAAPEEPAEAEPSEEPAPNKSEPLETPAAAGAGSN